MGEEGNARPPAAHVTRRAYTFFSSLVPEMSMRFMTVRTSVTRNK